MLIRRKIVTFLCLMVITLGSVAHAFDLEDYATTYRATRDAYLKAANEEKLATGPFDAAANSWIQAEMTEQLKAGNSDAVESLVKLKNKVSTCK